MRRSSNKMSPAEHPTVLLFGDVTDAWVDGIDYVHRKATTTPWLDSFLRDLFSAFRSEVRAMDSVLRDSFGACSNFQELAQRYRRPGSDEVGMVTAFLLYTLRAALLLETVHNEPLLLNPGDGRPETHLMGISGGLWNAVAVTTSSTFDSLYETSIETGRIYARLCNLTSIRSRAMEDRPGVWGLAIVTVDMSAAELEKTLERFQTAMGVPSPKRVKVAISGDRWSSVIGPPSVLKLVFSQCSELKRLPRNELTGIRARQHTLDVVSEADIDYIVGSSPLLAAPIRPGYRLWGMAGDDMSATYNDWGHLLRVAILQTLAQPLDIVQTCTKLSAHLGGSPHVDIKMMGPSGHASYVVNVLKARDTRKVSISDSLSQSDSDPEVETTPREGAIAIVGMSAKGPGSEDLDEFWNIIATGQDTAQEMPADRFDWKEYYCPKHSGPGGPGKCNFTCRHGCFIKNPGHFDNKFFHISPREALLMDPGHRLFLMNAYEALEMAGYSAHAQSKTTTDPNKIGVFFGQSADDWHKVTHHALGCDAYTMQCVQRAFGPGRLAFQMKWEGPTYAIDSACAGATSCIHLACLSLLSRDVDMAVAGAANILSDPHSFSVLSKAGVLSDTGNCKTYRDDADGYCRADFSGVVVLKRLEDALASNDNVLAVIASSGRNHSGNSTSITTSDANAQERLFNKVLRSARLRPEDVSYVEMHGTGTHVGDKAEMGAVTRVFSPRPSGQPLPVGAIKANIGHSEAAAGMSSVLKSVLMLQKGIVPPQTGMPHGLNPNVAKFLEDGKNGIVIPSEAAEFKSAVAGKPRRILVNNFDAAGGNSCVIIEDYNPDSMTRKQKQELDPRPSQVIATSARTPSSYLANMRRLSAWLRANPGARIQDIAYSTTARRVHHPIRFALTASTTQEAASKLEAEIERVSNSNSSSKSTSKNDVVFVYTGQGSHYAGMGAELYRTSAVFRQTVDLCVALCGPKSTGGFGFAPFLDIITDSSIDVSTKNAAQIQLAVVTLEMALTAFWRSCGIEPAMVMGHSLGEYAALQAAGVLSLTDTLYLVGQRARLLMERCEPGSCAMLSVSTSAEAARAQLDSSNKPLCGIACMNSPSATVISGPTEELAQLQADMAQKDGVRTKMLAVPFAFHSFQMDAILNDYKAIASGVSYLPPKIPVASTLLGSVVDAHQSDVFSHEYLALQTREAVDFCGALSAASKSLNTKDPVWLEIGPGPVCTSFVRATLSTSNVNHSIDANTNNWASISKTLASAYMSGVDVDWLAFHSPYEAHLELVSSLPTYAWDVKDYWITHTDRSSNNTLTETLTLKPSDPFLTTTAQYLVNKTLSPKPSVTFRAGISDHGFMGLIDGHKMQQIGLASGTVFSDAAATVAKYLLEQLSERTKNITITASNFTFHDPELLAPLTRDLVGLDGEVLTTASMDTPSSDTILVSFKARPRTETSGPEIDLGTIKVIYRDSTTLARTKSDLDNISFFIRSKLDERIHLSKSNLQGSHLFKPDVFFALFANAVEFSSHFRGVQEAYVSSDFSEAAALVVLKPDPEGTRFTLSPYWGEALLHLAGFMVNGNPAKPTLSTFAVMGYERVEQLEPVEAGRQYLTYTRISRWDSDLKDSRTAYCAGYVLDPETGKIVLQAVDLRYQEFKTATWRSILTGHGGGHGHEVKSIAAAAPGPSKTTIGDSLTSLTATTHKQKQPDQVAQQHKLNSVTTTETETGGQFQIILEALASATGSSPTEFSDDTAIADTGVDSIMAIEVVSAVKEQGVDLPAAFLFEYPTIGDLRRAFGGGGGGNISSSHQQHEPQAGDDGLDEQQPTCTGTCTGGSTPSSELETPDLVLDEEMVLIPFSKSNKSKSYSSLGSSIVDVEVDMERDQIDTPPPEPSSSLHVPPPQPSVQLNPNVQVSEDTSPPPTVRMTLLQGRPPKSSKSPTPLYLMADGTGSVACYLHLFMSSSSTSGLTKKQRAIYGVDSPFLKCPSRLLNYTGTNTGSGPEQHESKLSHLASLIVSNLLKHRPEGPFLIGGYSAGGLVAHEVTRQLISAGRTVTGLLVIDMCSPRLPPKISTTTQSLLEQDEFSYTVFQASVTNDNLWSSISTTNRDHFRAMFVAMNEYHPSSSIPADTTASKSATNLKTAIIWAEKGLIHRVSNNKSLIAKLQDQNVPTKPYKGFMQPEAGLGTFACLVPDKAPDNLGPNGWENLFSSSLSGSAEGEGGENTLALSVPGADHFEIMSHAGHVAVLREKLGEALGWFES